MAKEHQNHRTGSNGLRQVRLLWLAILVSALNFVYAGPGFSPSRGVESKVVVKPSIAILSSSPAPVPGPASIPGLSQSGASGRELLAPPEAAGFASDPVEACLQLLQQNLPKVIDYCGKRIKAVSAALLLL